MTELTLEPKSEIERNWAMLSHLLGLVPIPIVHILGPFLVWLIKKEESPFIDSHARESVNFQISIFVALLISGWLCLFVIGFLLIIVVLATDIVLVVTAALKAKNGGNFRYPLSLRFF